MSNLEYINQARKLLNEDYKTKHTNEYNGWLIKKQLSWTQPHVVVPFPPFVIGASTAPFKPSVSSPSENEIVAKALELYNRANPPAPTPTVSKIVSAPVIEEILPESVAEAEVVVEEIISEPIAIEVEEVVEEVAIEEIVSESVIEESIVEEPKPKAPAISYADAIYKIYEVMKKEGEADASPKFTTIDATLQTIPQPVEELAKVAKSNKAPTMMEKLQSIWSKKGDGNVQ